VYFGVVGSILGRAEISELDEDQLAIMKSLKRNENNIKTMMIYNEEKHNAFALCFHII